MTVTYGTTILFSIDLRHPMTSIFVEADITGKSAGGRFDDLHRRTRRIIEVHHVWDKLNVVTDLDINQWIKVTHSLLSARSAVSTAPIVQARQPPGAGLSPKDRDLFIGPPATAPFSFITHHNLLASLVFPPQNICLTAHAVP